MWRWVLGIYKSASQVRFIRIRNRKSTTLLSVIRKYVQEASLIWTDEFTSCKCLISHGHKHESVNHSKNYVDPITSAHTQGVERSWLESKEWYRASRGNKTLLQSHLHEAAWRKLRRSEKAAGTLFSTFLKGIGDCYRLW